MNTVKITQQHPLQKLRPLLEQVDFECDYLPAKAPQVAFAHLLVADPFDEHDIVIDLQLLNEIAAIASRQAKIEIDRDGLLQIRAIWRQTLQLSDEQLTILPLLLLLANRKLPIGYFALESQCICLLHTQALSQISVKQGLEMTQVLESLFFSARTFGPLWQQWSDSAISTLKLISILESEHAATD